MERTMKTSMKTPVKPKVQLYWNQKTDVWTARTNVPNLVIDMTLDSKDGRKVAFWKRLPFKVVVT